MQASFEFWEGATTLTADLLYDFWLGSLQDAYRAIMSGSERVFQRWMNSMARSTVPLQAMQDDIYETVTDDYRTLNYGRPSLPDETLTEALQDSLFETWDNYRENFMSLAREGKPKIVPGSGGQHAVRNAPNMPEEAGVGTLVSSTWGPVALSFSNPTPMGQELRRLSIAIYGPGNKVSQFIDPSEQNFAYHYGLSWEEETYWWEEADKFFTKQGEAMITSRGWDTLLPNSQRRRIRDLWSQSKEYGRAQLLTSKHGKHVMAKENEARDKALVRMHMSLQGGVQ